MWSHNHPNMACLKAYSHFLVGNCVVYREDFNTIISGYYPIYHTLINPSPFNFPHSLTKRSVVSQMSCRNVLMLSCGDVGACRSGNNLGCIEVSVLPANIVILPIHPADRHGIVASPLSTRAR